MAFSLSFSRGCLYTHYSFMAAFWKSVLHTPAHDLMSEGDPEKFNIAVGGRVFLWGKKVKNEA